MVHTNRILLSTKVLITFRTSYHLQSHLLKPLTEIKTLAVCSYFVANSLIKAPAVYTLMRASNKFFGNIFHLLNRAICSGQGYTELQLGPRMCDGNI